MNCGEANDQLLALAVESLKDFKNIRLSSTLACSVMKYATDAASREVAFECCKEALRGGEESHIAVSLICDALPNDRLAPLALNWCIEHPNEQVGRIYMDFAPDE